MDYAVQKTWHFQRYILFPIFYVFTRYVQFDYSNAQPSSLAI